MSLNEDLHYLFSASTTNSPLINENDLFSHAFWLIELFQIEFDEYKKVIANRKLIKVILSKVSTLNINLNNKAL
jgi:hypothetical protein